MTLKKKYLLFFKTLRKLKDCHKCIHKDSLHQNNHSEYSITKNSYTLLTTHFECHNVPVRCSVLERSPKNLLCIYL